MNAMTKDVNEKIHARSKVLYNKALERAHGKDISTAIDLLIKSLEFDKKFIDARNLLGLLYLRIGQVGEAIYHWRLSYDQNPVKEENRAFDFLKEVQGKKRQLDQYKSTVTMYNDALNYIQQGSEDLAIIRLKKAVNINEDFVLANNLLAYCYMQDGQPHKASNCIDRVLKIDCRNATALSYRNKIEAEQDEEGQEAGGAGYGGAKGNNFSNAPVFVNRRKEKGIASVSQIFVFIAGILIGAAAMTFLFTPDKLSKMEEEMRDNNSRFEAVKKDLEQQVTIKDKEITTLNDKIGKLEEDLKYANMNGNQGEVINTLLDISMKYQNGTADVIATAKAVRDLDDSSLSKEGKEMVKYLRETTYEKASQQANQIGEKNYIKKTKAGYEASLPYYIDAISFGLEGPWIEQSYYRIARVYKELGNYDESIKAFDVYFERYQSGAYYKWAQGHYDQVKKLKESQTQNP